jgi:Zn-dependent peptidase ImmA (M78 family)/DNA-binding XRE family transcriptional regulator
MAFSPTRLTLARKRRGFSIVELSRNVSVGPQSISNYENGRQEPLPPVAESIAETLRFPLGFFSGPEIDLLEPEAASFRARRRLSARKRDIALSSGRIAIEFSEWLNDRFRLPETVLPTLDKPDPETAAAMVRARWGLGIAPIRNMVHLLEAHGVRVFSLAPEYSDVDAFSVFHSETPFVFLNTMKSAARSRFDAAHELGHLVLHGQGCGPTVLTAEQEANEFASAFLMPRESVIGHMPPSPLIDQIIYAKRIWNVSALALTYRLHDIGMLSDWHYRTTCAELGQRGYRSSEPRDQPRESSQLLTKVFQLLRRKSISRSDIANDLSVNIGDLNDCIFGLVLFGLDSSDAYLGSSPGPASTHGGKRSRGPMLAISEG